MYRTTSVKSSCLFLAQESHGNGYISKSSPKFQFDNLQAIFGQFYFTDFGQNSD